MKRRERRRLGASVVLALAAGCQARPATEVVTVVHTDLAVGSALGGIQFFFAYPPEHPMHGAPLISDTVSCIPVQKLPVVLGLLRDAHAASNRFTVRVVGFADARCERLLGLKQSATTAFVAQEVRRVDLWLLAECVGAACAAEGMTCRSVDEPCVSDEVGAQPFDPAALSDGGEPLDGAPIPDGGRG